MNPENIISETTFVITFHWITLENINEEDNAQLFHRILSDLVWGDPFTEFRFLGSIKQLLSINLIVWKDIYSFHVLGIWTMVIAEQIIPHVLGNPIITHGTPYELTLQKRL